MGLEVTAVMLLPTTKAPRVRFLLHVRHALRSHRWTLLIIARRYDPSYILLEYLTAARKNSLRPLGRSAALKVDLDHR